MRKNTRHILLRKKRHILTILMLQDSMMLLIVAFISKTQIAILSSPTEIHLQKVTGDDKKQILRLSDKMQILRLFSSKNESELIISTSNAVLRYDLKGGKVLGQTEIDEGADIRQVVLS